MPALRSGSLTFDLQNAAAVTEGVAFDQLDHVDVWLFRSSFGSSNSHIDLSGDALDTAWAVEKLARESDRVELTDHGEQGRRLLARCRSPQTGFASALNDVSAIFREGLDDDEEDEVPESRIRDLRDEIWDFEEEVEITPPRNPEAIDAYLAELVFGANHELRSENPDFVTDQLGRFPERRYDFVCSAFSHSLGGRCFASPHSWILEGTVDLDRFFIATRQKYRASEYFPAKLFMVSDFPLLIFGAGLASHFPVRHFEIASACVSAVILFDDEEHAFGPGPASAMAELLRSRCELKIHESGAMAIIDDRNGFRHLLYDVDPLPVDAVKRVLSSYGVVGEDLALAAGLTMPIKCPWHVLDDDSFEELCYDLIRGHPDIDTATVRKLGKSRSRDGGRDIEAFEVRRSGDARPFKWIFQCKHAAGVSSLGARRVPDVGDMLDQFGAQGFGVMTNVHIDATLYDKLDAVCGAREVRQRNYSVLELEREISRWPSLRQKYFGC